MSTMTLIERNGSAEGVNPWLKTTVQQFFQGINWENRSQPQPAPSSSSSAPSAAGAAPPDLTVKVNQFFGAIAWDGTPAIAAPIPIEEPTPPPPSADKNVTLDDFFGTF